TCGRIEQLLLELFARKSLKRLWRCIATGWGPSPYFAPTGWEKLAPDRTVRPSSPILACFNTLDGSASYGAYIHRDLVWLEHIGAAFAVFAAVAGHIDLGMESLRELGWTWLSVHVWGVVELITLAMVAGMVGRARWTELQDRWTACRLGAEQLRI